MGRLIEKLKFAFALGDDTVSNTPLPSSLETLAKEVVARGLETPMLMLLETARPLSFLAGQSLHAIHPIAAPFFDEFQMREIAVALEDKHTIPKFIDRIEILASERR